MKKVIAIMLCMMVGVSCFALGAFAEEEPEVITTVSGHTYQEGEGTPSPDNVRNITGDFIQYVRVGDKRYYLDAPITLYDGDELIIYDDGSYSLNAFNAFYAYNNSSGWRLDETFDGVFRFIRPVATSTIFKSYCNCLFESVGSELPYLAYYPGSYSYRNDSGNLYVNFGAEIDTLGKFNVQLSETPLQVLIRYVSPEVRTGSYFIVVDGNVNLINNIRPFCTNIFSTISSVSNSIVSTPVLLLSFGFFLIGGMIGLFGRMLSRG